MHACTEERKKAGKVSGKEAQVYDEGGGKKYVEMVLLASGGEKEKKNNTRKVENRPSVHADKKELP